MTLEAAWGIIMNENGTTQLRHSFLLLMTAIIWGSGFVAQSVGMDYIGPFTFTAVRNLIGTVVLVPLVLYIHYGPGAGRKKPRQASFTYRYTISGGICCGVFLCIASNFQQFGIMYTTVGKAGFITALYVVFVPVLGLFLRKRVSVFIWISVALSVIGLYLLCMTENTFTLQFGDFLELICALMFSVHIMVIDHFTGKADSVVMSAVQFLVCGLISLLLMFLFETPDISRIIEAWQPVLYAGIFASGMGYTLQMVGQKGVDPTVASLIMCMESVVSAVAGWLILGQKLSIREVSGCILMFAAIVLAQLPVSSLKEKAKVRK